MEAITVVHVKKFLEHQAAPVQMSEMTIFWKNLSENEKNEHRAAVSKWDGKSQYIN